MGTSANKNRTLRVLSGAGVDTFESMGGKVESESVCGSIRVAVSLNIVVRAIDIRNVGAYLTESFVVSRDVPTGRAMRAAANVSGSAKEPAFADVGAEVSV